MMKAIPSCPDYFADEDGNILRSGKVLAVSDNGHGYKKLKVSIDGVASDRYVHRLVCEAYHGAPPTGHHARHKNGRRADNRPANLAWSTRVENEADKVLHGTLIRGEAASNAKLTEAQVVEARGRAAAGERQDYIAAGLGVSERLIGAAIRGARWKHVPGAVAPGTNRRKFSDDEVREIRRLAQGETQKAIADRFGVARNAIWQIIHRVSYGHIS